MNWTDKIQVFREDCKEVMKRYPDNHFDLAIVDPPYGIKINKMNFVTSGRVKVGGAYRNDYSNFDTQWDELPPDSEYFKELKRVSKNQIIWGWNYFVPHLNTCKCYIVWDKRTEDKYSNDFADCEQAWTSFDRPARVYRYLWSGMLQGDMKNKEKRIHPTQKPVNLYRKLLTDFAKEGDKIIDTHFGSGSIALACHELGFELVASEISEKIHNSSFKRFKNEAKLSLFS